MHSSASILVARTDRLGDVILSLPVLSALRKTLPTANIDFICRRSCGEAIAPFLNSANINWLDYEPERKFCLSKPYVAALVLFEDRSLLKSVWRAGVSHRVGPLSKFASLLWLNHGVRQKRSRAVKHEAQYNLDLGERLLKVVGEAKPLAAPDLIEIPVDSAAEDVAVKVLEEKGIHAEEKFIVVHPGMGGSAENLSPEGYVRIIDTLARSFSGRFLISCGPAFADGLLSEQIRKLRPSTGLFSGLSLSVLREIFRKASLVVAPSTGPLHLAHYVGATTVGIYSPVQSQVRDRWEPWGGTGKSYVLTSKVPCQGKRYCVGRKCEYYYCLEREDWSGVLQQSVV